MAVTESRTAGDCHECGSPIQARIVRDVLGGRFTTMLAATLRHLAQKGEVDWTAGHRAPASRALSAGRTVTHRPEEPAEGEELAIQAALDVARCAARVCRPKLAAAEAEKGSGLELVDVSPPYGDEAKAEWAARWPKARGRPWSTGGRKTASNS